MMFDICRLPVQKGVHALSMGENGLLMYLYMNPEGATAGRISRDLRVGTGAVANVMNSLEKKGCILRTMNPRDRRSVIVRLSGEGQALIRERMEELVGNTRCLLSALGEEDTRTLLRIYRRVLIISREASEKEKPREA